jgi:hypothetical protein
MTWHLIAHKQTTHADTEREAEKQLQWDGLGRLGQRSGEEHSEHSACHEGNHAVTILASSIINGIDAQAVVVVPPHTDGVASSQQSTGFHESFTHVEHVTDEVHTFGL